MAVRKYKYDGKEYDLDALKKSALSNWQGTDKDYRAMVEILQHMTDDEGSYADLDKINFSSNYATEKGMFGKNRENSKHYKRAVGYLLKQFQGMSPYEEPVVEAPAKTKLGRGTLRDYITNFGNLNSDSYKGLSEAQRIEVLKDAINKTNNHIKWDNPELYDIEEGYDMNSLKGYLTGLTDAFGTPEQDDDAIALHNLGITSPYQTQQAADTLKTKMLGVWNGLGYSAEEFDQRIWPFFQQMAPLLFFKQAGLGEDVYKAYTEFKPETNPDSTTTNNSTLANNPNLVNDPQENYTKNIYPKLPNYMSLSEQEQLDLDKQMIPLMRDIYQNMGKYEKEAHPYMDIALVNGRSGKSYIVVDNLAFTDSKGHKYLYGYDPEHQKKDGTVAEDMVIIPVEEVKQTDDPKLVVSKAKGGRLSTLRNNNIYG